MKSAIDRPRPLGKNLFGSYSRWHGMGPKSTFKPKRSSNRTRKISHIVENRVRNGSNAHGYQTPQLMTPRKRFTTKEGVPCLLFPKNESTMERRLKLGCSMTELLAICVQLVEALDVLPIALQAHGNLHPRNVFVSSRGVIQLSDPITPTLAKEYQALCKAKSNHNPFMPPEIRQSKIRSPQEVFVDTYSIAMILLNGVMGTDQGQLPHIWFKQGT